MDKLKTALWRNIKEKLIKETQPENIPTFRCDTINKKNTIKVELPHNVKIHPVIHVKHTTPFKTQPTELKNFKTLKPEETKMKDGSIEYGVQDILNHKNVVEDIYG